MDINVVAVTQARIGSSRLPGKVLLDIDGKPLLEVHLQRVALAKRINSLIVATTLEPEAEQICRIAEKEGLLFYRGSMNDVLDRFYQSVKDLKPDWVVRVTSDCPLLDPAIIDELITFALDHQFDYASNTLTRSYPDGMDVEVFTFQALKQAWEQAKLPSEREHVTPYIWKNCDVNGGTLFRAGSLVYPQDFGDYRLTVDEPEDLELIRRLVAELGLFAGWRTYTDFLQAHPGWRQLNQGFEANEGYSRSLKNDG